MSTFTVTTATDGGAGSFRQAIIDANAVPNSTINFAASFAIALTSALPVITVGITINGNLSSIDGNGLYQCLAISPAVAGSSVAITQLSFVNGFSATGNAGLSITNADVTLTSLGISGNVGNVDAGLQLNGCTVGIVDCVIANNTSATVGGGISASGSALTLTALTVNATAISNNTALTRGGGVYIINGSSLNTRGDNVGILVNGNVLNTTANVTALGIGICSDTCPVDIANVTFENNLDQTTQVNGFGGGIGMNADVDTTLVINNCTFIGNRCGSGGGVYSTQNGMLTITDSTFNDNHAIGISDGRGGALLCGNLDYGGLIVTNNTATRDGGGILISQDATGIIQPVPLAAPSQVDNNECVIEGGGIAMYGSASITLFNMTISNNTATIGAGGGIRINAAPIKVISNCVISGNSCGANGGGINSYMPCVIQDSTISNNTAVTSGGGFADSTPFQVPIGLTMTNCTVSSNTAARNAGISISVGPSTITNCIIATNTSLDADPGNTSAAGIRSTAALTLDYTSIIGNIGTGVNASFGLTVSHCNVGSNTIDGVRQSGPLAISNSTIGNNGRIGFYSANVTVGIVRQVTNVTIARNTIGLVNDPNSISINVVNTIVALNTTSDVTGTFNSQGNNLIQDTTGSTGFTQPTDITGVDPLLDNYANNGGPTLTMALLNLSPAYEAGNNALAIGPYDQRGVGFNRVVNSAVDIGAYESQFVICFVKESLLLVKSKITGVEGYVRADEVTSHEHLIYECNSQSWQPIVHNIVTYNCNRFIKFEAGSFGDGVPKHDVFITSGHFVLYDGKMTKARDVPCGKVVYLDYQHVYSICLGESGRVLLNGMVVKAEGVKEWEKMAKERKLQWCDNLGK